MEFHSSHPLDNITRQNPYSMLEALIPFVDYPMKLVLLFMIKYQEMRLLLDAFQSVDNLSKYGLHNSSNNPFDMLGNIMGVSPEMLKTFMSFAESRSNDATAKDYVNQTFFSDKQSDNSFDENIKNIFAEYDLLQAAEYNEESRDLSANSINSEPLSEPEYYI